MASVALCEIPLFYAIRHGEPLPVVFVLCAAVFRAAAHSDCRLGTHGKKQPCDEQIRLPFVGARIHSCYSDIDQRFAPDGFCVRKEFREFRRGLRPRCLVLRDDGVDRRRDGSSRGDVVCEMQHIGVQAKSVGSDSGSRVVHAGRNIVFYVCHAVVQSSRAFYFFLHIDNGELRADRACAVQRKL